MVASVFGCDFRRACLGGNYTKLASAANGSNLELFMLQCNVSVVAKNAQANGDSERALGFRFCFCTFAKFVLEQVSFETH